MGESPDLQSSSGTDAFNKTSRVMIAGERIVFIVVGILLFVAALALAYRSIGSIVALFAQPESDIITNASYFLDIVLLILMLAEIAYTVTLSVRGAVLSAQPFLIVGLIAVIRRILVITVQEVQPTGAHGRSLMSYAGSSIDVAILTLVVLVFVFSLYLLRRREPEDGG